MNKTLMACVLLSLCACGTSTLSSFEPDAEELVDDEASVSSELTSARPLMNLGLGIVSRQSWGARPAGTCRRGQVPDRVIVHHAGGSVSNPRSWLSWYDNELRVQRGWCDLMYHFGVDEQGVIYEMVATGVEGAHASSANVRTVAILLMGDYTTRAPSAAQVASLQKLLRGLNQAYGIPLDRSRVLGHRQVGQTSCPGNTAYPKLDGWVAGAKVVTPPATGAVPVPATFPAFTAQTTGLRLASVGATRLLDTRDGAPLAGGQVRRAVTAAQSGGAQAMALGVTLIQPQADTFLSVAGGTAVGPTSTVNAQKGAVRANQTLVALPGGVASMFAPATTHVVVDEQARFGATGSGFTPLGPTRLLDTRGGLALKGGVVRTVSLASLGVPATAVAAQVGLAAIPRGVAGFVSVVPCGEAVTTSALNFAGTQVASSGALAAVRNGTLCLFSSTTIDLVVDVAGYYAPGGRALSLAKPARLLDTRSGEGGWKGLPDANQVLRLDLSRMPGWAGSAAVAFNLTGVSPTSPGFARVWDCTGAPEHSSLNSTPGAAVGTFGVVKSTGALCVTSTTRQHLIVDLVGVYR